jgi:hypothetical protein
MIDYSRWLNNKIRVLPAVGIIGYAIRRITDHRINPFERGQYLPAVPEIQRHPATRRGIRRSIQRRVTLQFEFGLPSPPWMS